MRHSWFNAKISPHAKLAALWFVSFLLLSFFAAQDGFRIEITAEPSHHLAFENQYVRVFKVEVAPHATTLMHRHRYDYIFVVLGPPRW